MKIIFLDIDGVLNSHKSGINNEGSLIVFSEEAIHTLNSVIRETGAVVVVSSSWRCSYTQEGMQALLASKGINCKVVGMTPDLTKLDASTNLHIAVPRGEEILTWLRETKENVESICIIDDGDDMQSLRSKLVQTTWDSGLLSTHADKIKEKLNEPLSIKDL